MPAHSQHVGPFGIEVASGTVHDPHVSMTIQQRALPSELVRLDEIIRVEELDVPAARQLQPAIAGGRRSRVRLLRVADSGVVPGQPRNHVGCSIRGPVVQDDRLPGPFTLTLHARERLRDQMAVIVTGTIGSPVVCAEPYRHESALESFSGLDTRTEGEAARPPVQFGVRECALAVQDRDLRG